MTEVVLKGVFKSFLAKPPTVALRGVSLAIPSEGIVAVLGASGCGKTTMLRLIAGFERVDGGSITIGDSVVSTPQLHVRPERRRVGIVPQEGALFPHLNVEANIAFGLRSLDRAARVRRVDELLDLVGLSGYNTRRPQELSGGQQQRVALARALAPDPDVIVMDEPFSALDSTLRASLRAEVAALLHAAGATALLVTHDQDEAFSFADSIAVMRSGVIVQHATPSELYRTPTDLETARFVGEAVELHATLRDQVVECVLGSLPATPARGQTSPPPDGEVVAVLRPEQIVPSKTSAVMATIEREQYHGHDALVTLRVGSEGVAARWPATTRYRVGDTVGIEVIGSALVFERPSEVQTIGGAAYP